MGRRSRNWDLWLRLPTKYNSDSKFKNGSFIVSVSLFLGSVNESLLIPRRSVCPLESVVMGTTHRAMAPHREPFCKNVSRGRENVHVSGSSRNGVHLFLSFMSSEGTSSCPPWNLKGCCSTLPGHEHPKALLSKEHPHRDVAWKVESCWGLQVSGGWAQASCKCPGHHTGGFHRGKELPVCCVTLTNLNLSGRGQSRVLVKNYF